MAAEFRQTAESEIEEVRALLQQSFKVNDSAPSISRPLLRWKYYESGPAWPGSRSYVLVENGRFIAHAAISPIQLRLGNGVRSGIGFGDWAASEEHRGIGLQLLKKLTALASFTLVIGGADITRQILPRVGFKPWTNLPLFVRVLRPVRRSLSRPSHNWKEPLRLGRNTIWSLSSVAPVNEWSYEFAVPSSDTLSSLENQTGSIHRREFIEFLLHCPSVPFRSLVLLKAGLPQGYAVLSFAGGQARIADLRIASTLQEDWNSATAVVVKAMLSERSACEAIANASSPLLEIALQSNGFRIREQLPLIVLDREGQMTTEPVPHLSMLLDDATFNYFPESPYLT